MWEIDISDAPHHLQSQPHTAYMKHEWWSLLSRPILYLYLFSFYLFREDKVYKEDLKQVGQHDQVPWSSCLLYTS